MAASASKLSNAGTYSRRFKICEAHRNADVVLVARQEMRYCQQCSKLHEVAKFDGTKRWVARLSAT
jgi:hypothetical protein